MNELNWLPDWKKATSYPDPDPDNTPMKQWAWEFLRRNSEYQADYQKLISFEYGKIIDADERIKMMETNDYKEWSKLASEMQAKYCLDNCIPSPECNFKIGILKLKGAYTGLYEKIHKNYGEGTKRAIEFDLNKPIEPQLIKAREALQHFQKALELSPKRTRHDVRMFRDYLRILDAKTAKATNAEIEHTLYPDDENDTQSKLKKGLRAAKQLCITGYKQMI